MRKIRLLKRTFNFYNFINIIFYAFNLCNLINSLVSKKFIKRDYDSLTQHESFKREKDLTWIPCGNEHSSF